MTELILIRHGETDWNRELRFQGQVDVPLNAAGHEQARRVAERLAGESVQQLVCSDLLRTRQTAEQPAQRLRLDAVSDVALREQNFGLVDGMRVDDIKAQYPQAWDRWIAFDENYAFDGRRKHPGLPRPGDGRDAAPGRGGAGRRLVVVTHGGVLDMVYRTAKGLSLSGPRQSLIPNGGISRVRMAGDAIDILSWAEIGHLAGLPEQPVYDQAKSARVAGQSPGSTPSIA